jgi:hypothetical protein
MTKLKPTVDLGYPTEPLGDIPSFNNIEEEAEWWDTHDTTDFQHLFKPVRIKIGGELAEQIASQREESERVELAEKLTLRLDRADRAALTKFAKRKGVGPSTLARMWIKEHLEEEAAREAKAS